MNVPEDLRYSTEHEWAQTEGTRVRVGITDYAQDALGDMVFIDLPDGGRRPGAGGLARRGGVDQVGLGDLRTGGGSGGGGQRDPARDRPSSSTRTRTAAGWICEIELAEPAALDELLIPAAYRTLIEP